LDKKDWHAAIPFLEHAAAISREVGDKWSEARSCSTLSSIYTGLRQPSQAQAFSDMRDRILATGPSALSKFKENDEMECDGHSRALAAGQLLMRYIVIVVKAANLSFIREPQIKPLPDSSEVPLVVNTLQELLKKLILVSIRHTLVICTRTGLSQG